MIALLVMTDGRATIRPTITSAMANLSGPITEFLIHDDSGDEWHRERLRHKYPQFTVISGGERQGFAGAIRSAWSHLRTSDARFVFHLEDDFTFNRPLDLAELIRVLDCNPHLAQLALRRQPWNDVERTAGGIVESRPAEYDELSDGVATWLEHRLFFTTNPCLYRRSLTAKGWPAGAESEGRFGLSLFADPAVRSGYWGERTSGEWVTHIGDDRAGTGY